MFYIKQAIGSSSSFNEYQSICCTDQYQPFQSKNKEIKYSWVFQTMVKILWLLDILLYIHKQLTGNSDLIELARQFCAVLDECREHFGAFI